METIYIFLIFAIGVIIAIGVGLELSKGIDEFIIYVLFWFLYIITIITFINIILVGNYYLTMRNKQGPPGLQGEQGDIGDKGDAGKCDASCRDSICENAITELLHEELKRKNAGVRVNMNNVYIKSKIRQMCSSNEFRQLAPYNGPINLINYLKDIWKIWISLLYDAGGMLYFETIGAEDQFEWLSSNPFDELKKYDVFYWGMGKQYRPQIINKCYPSNDGETPIPESSGVIIQIANTDLFEYITSDDNSQAFHNASFWRAKQFTYKTAVFYPVGDIVIGPIRKGEHTKSKKHIGAITLPKIGNGPARETILVSGDVKGPVNYELLWTNHGWTTSGNKQPTFFWIWRPIAPVNYIALGDIVTTSADFPMTGDSAPIRCVPDEIVKRLKTSKNILWSSNGSPVDININLVGYNPNDGGYQKADGNNAYNLFRGVVGWGTEIPATDINGNFYYLDKTKYNANFVLGEDTGRPDISSDGQKVGKGYIPTPQKDSKYSVIAYLNLKNNPILQHQNTKNEISAMLIPNAISNAYIIKPIKSSNGAKCLNLEGNSLIISECDELVDTQYFSISFTGNKSNLGNQCVIKHFKTGKLLNYDGKVFTLVKNNLDDNHNYNYNNMQQSVASNNMGDSTLFIML